MCPNSSTIQWNPLKCLLGCTGYIPSKFITIPLTKTDKNRLYYHSPSRHINYQNRQKHIKSEPPPPGGGGFPLPHFGVEVPIYTRQSKSSPEWAIVKNLSSRKDIHKFGKVPSLTTGLYNHVRWYAYISCKCQTAEPRWAPTSRPRLESNWSNSPNHLEPHQAERCDATRLPNLEPRPSSVPHV